MNHPDLPPPELLQQQADWLAAARGRLLRRVQVARRRRVLDLGCGRGIVTGELVRRSGGTVVALDRNRPALGDDDRPFADAARVCADAARLPFAQERFDLVFCQFALLWMDAPAAVGEIRRVLRPGGLLVAIEPDYGGMIEYPAEIATRDLWLAGITRAGGDPLVGRKLPGLLRRAGWDVRVDLLDRLEPPSPTRFDLLRGLPLDADQRATLDHIAALSTDALVHLPLFLITATK